MPTRPRSGLPRHPCSNSASRLPSGPFRTSTTRPPRDSSPSGEHTVQLRDANTWEPVGGVLSTRTEDVRAVAFSPDGTFLAVGGSAR